MTLVQRGRIPRGLAVARRLRRRSSSSLVARSATSCPNPIADQVRAFQRDVPGLVDDANESLRRPPGVRSTTRASTSRSRRQGETALETLQDEVLEGSGEVVSFTGDLLRELVEVVDPARPRARPEHLHAALRAAHRRARALGHAAGRRDAGGRLPDARAEGGRRATCAARCSSARSWARAPASRCGSTARSGSSSRADATRWPSASSSALMELVPFVGPDPRRAAADPRRAVRRPADRRLGRRCSSSRCSSSRATSSRRRSSRYTLRINPLLVIFALLFGARDLRDRRRARRAADRGDAARDRASTCAATSCSSRGATAPLALAGRPTARRRRARVRDAADAGDATAGSAARAGL